MDSIFERQRKYHEELEVLEKGIVDLYHSELKTSREKLIREHQTSKYVDLMSVKFDQLRKSYEEEEEVRSVESSSLSGPSSMHLFYQKLAAIKNFHQSNPNQLAEPSTQVLSMTEDVNSTFDSLFSGPEAYGKYLDLFEPYEIYLNLIKSDDKESEKTLSYLDYLHIVDQFLHLPLKVKLKAKYKGYLELLYTYLKRFYKLINPLEEHLELEAQAKLRFELEFKEGKLKGWSFVAESQLYCEICELYFTKPVLLETHKNSKKHKKNQTNRNQANGNNSHNDNQNGVDGHVNGDQKYQVAKLEYLVVVYFQLLEQIKEDTLANVERKLTLTEREREIEQELEDVELVDSESDNDDDRIYNPLKLPLGWDGKPIPYWLYKLHGLGVEYPCEVCGNFVYMGRKAFERHFQEWRHAYGMRCLGIPNTRHFHEITSIEDVYSLWEQLKQTTKQEKQQLENVEEYEDSRGNVLNRKTYDDLKRQGLL